MARSPRNMGPAGVQGETETPGASVNSTSLDYNEQITYWKMVRDMMKGTKAMRKNASTYLPKFEAEDDKDFRERTQTARYTNIFADIVKNLSDRPFNKEPTFKANAVIEPMLENIDGQNNHAQIFMAEWLREAITTGIHWCFVDYSQVNPNVVDVSGVQRRKSVAEERQEGARPYCLLVAPEDLIAVYSGMIAGKEYIVHARIRELYTVRDGWGEKQIEVIRVLNRDPIYDENKNIVDYHPATFQIWERKDAKSFAIISEGPIWIGEIALVPLIIGARRNGWQIDADMEDCAYLQLEYFEQENGLKNIKTLTAYPMLSAEGVEPQIDPQTKQVRRAPVGPRATLYGGAPKAGVAQGGRWTWIEPAGSSLTFLREDLKELAKEIRELGRQPLTASSSNITKETSAFASAKGKSAIKRWVGSLKDAMENVLMYMARWENIQDEPEVIMNLDDLDQLLGDTSMTSVEKMFADGVISRRTYRTEAQRRNILSESFDPDEEDKQIEDEVPDDPSLDDEQDALLNPNGDISPDVEDEEDPPTE